MIMVAPDTVTDVLLALHAHAAFPVCAVVPLTFMCMAPGGRNRFLKDLMSRNLFSVALCNDVPAGHVQW
jgi:hypothetical protein